MSTPDQAKDAPDGHGSEEVPAIIVGERSIPGKKKKRKSHLSKPDIAKKQRLNGAIRHKWMATWYLNLVNISMVEDEYSTPGTPYGFHMFVQFLFEIGKEAISEFLADLIASEGNIDKASKEDNALLEMCKQGALNWKREWALWLDSAEKKEWITTEEGALVWGVFTTDEAFLTNRNTLAEEIEGWFNASSGSTGRVVTQRQVDEPITDPSLTCISLKDLYSPWDDSSHICSDSQHDYHLVRFVGVHLVNLFGASMVYVAKRFKRVNYERHILPQHRMFSEMQVCGVRMCGLVNPVAMINDYECPTLIFPYWNGGTLEDMLGHLREFQNNRMLGFNEAPEQRLAIFMDSCLEISLALLETLRYMHSKGWLHNSLHARNILLHFPTWQWTKKGEQKVTGTTDLVFVGISNFGRCCKVTGTKEDWAPKFGEWNWEINPVGPPRHIAPELYMGENNRLSPSDGSRFYTELTDVYALGTSIRGMCKNYFEGWERVHYIGWHDRLDHTQAFRDKKGVASRLVHLLHRLAHPDMKIRKTAKTNARQWKEDLGVNSRNVYRPLAGWFT